MGLCATLIALALYLALLGLLFLFALDLAAAVLGIVVYDPVPFRQWGAALLILASLAALLAADPVRYRRLLLVPLLGLVLDSVILAYELLTGTSGPRQAAVPLIVNLVLFALLVIFYPRGALPTADEVPGPGLVEESWLPFLKRKGTE